jgi:hypothetical protein
VEAARAPTCSILLWHLDGKARLRFESWLIDTAKPVYNARPVSEYVVAKDCWREPDTVFPARTLLDKSFTLLVTSAVYAWVHAEAVPPKWTGTGRPVITRRSLGGFFLVATDGETALRRLA